MSAQHSSALPIPRRIIIGTNADLTPALIDDHVPEVELPIGSHTAVAFVQPSFSIDPVESLKGASQEAGGFVQPDGVLMRWADFPPNVATPVHYTDSIDYLIMTAGELELVLHDGQKTTARQGDVIVQLGSVHQWVNKTNEWARFVAVMLANKPTVIDGKTLEQSLKAPKF